MGVVAACATALPGVVVPSALADDPPPDLSASTFHCHPENAVPPLLGSTRPGDVVVCQLVVGLAGSSNAYHVTADIAIPDGTSWAPLPNAQGIPVPADAPTHLHFDETKLGLLNPGIPKPASIRLLIDAAALPGTPIVPVATVRDPLAQTFTVAADQLAVMPQPADLEPSTTTCANADPTRTEVRAGDTVVCSFLLANKPNRENATDVSLTVGLPGGTAWTAGGNESFHFGKNLNWLPSVLPGGVPSGGVADPALTTHLQIDPAVLGGTIIYVNGTVNWTNASSGVAGGLGLGSRAIVITPGPAVVTASTLVCADDDGPPLLAQDIVNCTATLRAAAGHEAVADAAGSAALPGLTVPVTSVDGTGRIPFVELAGTVTAGSEKAARYRFRVAPGAVQGNVIVPTAVVSGRSVPSGGAVRQELVATPLVVGVRGAATVAPAVRPSGAAVVAAAGAKPAARGPVICASRRVVTVNVRPPKGRHWKGVTFAFAKKAVKGKKATGTLGKKGYYRARLVFQGLPKGPLTVAVTGTTTRGKKVKSSRTYNLCAPKKT
ncbi:hypothetical protein [Baekduia alba]|uniref:hypothetical protein n=1 Tax=Baekduia alba TaxID=2997333 RepID=UPI0023408C71|nr:hypothetical protein [Baekduia alba]